MVVSIDERRHQFSVEEYVDVAERSPTRLEFWDGEILDTSGGSPRHSAICAILTAILGAQLRGTPCRAYDANLRARSVHANRATYADVTVVCGPLELDPQDRTRQTVLNPTVLFEVLSPTTARDDQGPKLESYRLVPSVQAVVLIAQDKPEITARLRQPDGSWAAQTHVDGQLDLPAIQCQLVLAEVYEALPEA